ncbi:MAG TPA: hypothetical protein DIT34_05575 [Acinetobacter ursingii]|uniref:Lipoprotein n=1 Tax=Acinetobacter ursingii TaxID=108980 RepID=A0A3D2SN57_9GAMM|nr:hypothetical protein [Acinetobacter ursingii]MCH2004210.1 hypothetical protein [Acinetobacter ursingii]MCU4380868.1 hypothetical protein [Acinetobacter ursingii]MCU4608042.1 hypothetical protein [Acinetobacter ursingii]MDU4394048.1 hypothetical protein [Acinetobacter ursingii]HCK30428.1 hypothetical protein [Acinetobacter ursingii]
MERQGTALYIMIVLLGGLGCSGYTTSATPLNENVLRNESDSLERVTPPVVKAVEQDAKKPVSEQKNLNQNIAKKHSKQLIQDNLDASVLSEYEEQKKITEPTRTSIYLQQQIPELPPYQEKVRMDKLNLIGPQLGNAKGDVTITINK